ncbi:transketolase subunit A [Ignisphaera aggregans DSM 17230]|uniref:2-oxoacid oxidoreductase (ferredoxin) n=1 Tax=Ignisphaera aggregans (strain DSM 17230 / JCM 13409 / AQ1.S1) TaxID=583356 RepID=E0SS69_IGNAA|nr:transketolase subunit A [Ignisphaera aggregans DSM 17230]
MVKVDAAPILNKPSLEDINSIEAVANSIRRSLIIMHKHEKFLHMGSSLSSVDIIATLMFRYINRNGDPLNRDWFILSKGHAAPTLYAALAELGLIPKEELIKIQSIDSILQGHPEISIPGVDMSTGSLGQGISFAVGIAAWIKSRGGRGRVYVLMGDGEQDEGQVWEAITHAATLKLDNLIVIIDANGFQLDGKVDEVKPKPYLPFVWKAIGWRVLWCDGHDIASIMTAIEEALESDRPTVIFAKTIRGYGLKHIENTDKQRVEDIEDVKDFDNNNA